MSNLALASHVDDQAQRASDESWCQVRPELVDWSKCMFKVMSNITTQADQSNIGKARTELLAARF